jgi:hypothetical protein
MDADFPESCCYPSAYGMRSTRIHGSTLLAGGWGHGKSIQTLPLTFSLYDNRFSDE